jgi:hypothetical protein
MYWSTIFCAVQLVWALVPQGLCRNVGSVLQESGVADKGDGNSLLGLPFRCKLRQHLWCESERKLKQMDRRVDDLQEKVQANTGGLEEVQEKVDTVEKRMEKLEKKNRRKGGIRRRRNVRGAQCERSNQTEFGSIRIGGAGSGRYGGEGQNGG